jgi:hypothetical protein
MSGTLHLAQAQSNRGARGRKRDFPACPQVPSARHGAPQTLCGIGHKAEGQFICHQPLHQPFGVDDYDQASPEDVAEAAKLL